MDRPIRKRLVLQEHREEIAVALRRNFNAELASRRPHGHVLTGAGENDSAPDISGETVEGDELNEGGVCLHGDDDVLVDIDPDVKGVVDELCGESAVILDESERG